MPPDSSFHFLLFAKIPRFFKNRLYIDAIFIQFVYRFLQFRLQSPFKRGRFFSHLHKFWADFPRLSTAADFFRATHSGGRRFLPIPCPAAVFLSPARLDRIRQSADRPFKVLFNVPKLHPLLSFDKPNPADYTTPRIQPSPLVRQIFPAVTSAFPLRLRPGHGGAPRTARRRCASAPARERKEWIVC